MWPFTRKAEAPTERAPAMPVPVMRQEWKQLPAMQRTFGEHPLTAPPAAFAGDLVTHQDPSVTSGPLGHDVTHEAPAGLVMGLVSPFARPSTRDTGPAMIHRPRVQRQARSSGETLDDAAAAEAGGPDQDGLAFAETVREVPAVAGQPVAQRLTTMAPDLTPVPVGKGLALPSRPRLQRAITVEPEGADLTGPSANLTGGSPDLVGASADTGDAAAIVPGGPQRLTLGQSRRLGLGAPLRQVPTSAVQRAADLPLARQASAPAAFENTLPEATPERIESRSEAASVQAKPAGVDRPDHEPVSAPDSPSLSAFSLDSRPAIQRAALDLPLAPTGRADATESPAPIAATDAGTTGDIDGALVGASGAPGAIGSSLTNIPSKAQADRSAAGTIQRTVEPEIASPTAAANLDLPLLQRRAASASGETQGPARWSLPGRSAVAAVAPLAGTRSLSSLQRVAQPAAAATAERTTLAPTAGGVLDFAEFRTERGRTAAATFVQRSNVDADSYGTTNSDGDSMPGPTLVPMPQASQPMASSPSVQRLPLQPQPQAIQRSEMALAPVASVASVQRATQIAESAIAVASQPMISAQRESFASEPAWPASEASVQAAPATSAASSSATGPSGAAHPDENLDALAGKLYDRIRNRLKSELLLDRERAGLLTDLRG